MDETWVEKALCAVPPRDAVQGCMPPEGSKLSNRTFARAMVSRARLRIESMRAKVNEEKKKRVIAEVYALIECEKDKRRNVEQDPVQSERVGNASRMDSVPLLTETGTKDQSDRKAQAADKATQVFCYVCPFCQGAADSRIKSGKVDHRHVCGHQFRVLCGQIVGATKVQHVYTCPFCEGSVRSSVRTGQINHRSVCGHQFYVKDGAVGDRQYAYTCPFCQVTVRSNIRTGRINHRRICGHRFYVKDAVVIDKAKSFEHRCPQCDAVILSACQSGRIQTKHKTPAGKLCSTRAWKVTKNRKEKKQKSKKSKQERTTKRPGKKAARQKRKR